MIFASPMCVDVNELFWARAFRLMWVSLSLSEFAEMLCNALGFKNLQTLLWSQILS